MNEDQMKSLVNAIGALAEMTSMFYKELVNNGVAKTDAVVLTGEFIKNTFPHI